MSKTLILMVGLPRSGKSTVSRKIARDRGCPVVARDAVRLALHGCRFRPEAEEFVAASTKMIVRALFIAGHDTIIVDECHCTQKSRAAWQSPYWHVVYVVIGTSPSVCIERAIIDFDSEIIPVIERMAGEWDDPQLSEFQVATPLKPLPACGGPEGRTQ